MKKRTTLTELKIRGVTLEEKAALEMIAYTRGVSVNQVLKETVTLLTTEKLSLTLETMQVISSQLIESTLVLSRVEKLLEGVMQDDA